MSEPAYFSASEIEALQAVVDAARSAADAIFGMQLARSEAVGRRPSPLIDQGKEARAVLQRALWRLDDMSRPKQSDITEAPEAT